jgi:thiol-disulfide isomerase/thioredoxin
MKWRPIVVFFLLELIAPVASGVEAGDPAPAWRSENIAGQEVIFPGPSGRQVTVLVFWATWCNYCRAFMPYLAAIQEEYSHKNVQVLAVNAKEDDGEDESGAEDPRSYMDRNGYGLVTVLNGDAIAAAYAVEFIPGLFVVDASGMIIYRRGWTELPAGRKVAEFWDEQVRSVLNVALE